MSSFTAFNPALGPLHPAARANGSQFGPPTMSVMVKLSTPPTSPQLKPKEKNSQLKEILSAVSRREMISLAGLSLAVYPLLSPEPAEARMTKIEMKNKILEKLRALREKFRSSKPKDNEGKEQTSAPPKDSLVEVKTYAPQEVNSSDPEPAEEKKVVDESVQKAMPQPINEDGDKPAPQFEDEGGESPTSLLEDQGGYASVKEQENEEKYVPEKDESLLLPFLSLTDAELEPLVEASLSH